MSADEWEDVNRVAAEDTSAALSQLIGRPVSVDVASAEVKRVAELSPIVSPEEIVAGIYLPVTGDVEGAALVVFPKESALLLSDVLLKRPPGTTRQLAEMDESALKETGNIVCGNYLAALSNILHLRIIEHVPIFSFDMFGAITDEILATFAQKTEDALVVEIRFSARPTTIKGYLLLMFAADQMSVIMGPLEGA